MEETRRSLWRRNALYAVKRSADLLEKQNLFKSFLMKVLLLVSTRMGYALIA